MSREQGAPLRRKRRRPRPVSWWRRLTGSAAPTTLAFGLLVCACSLIAVAGPRASAELRTNAFRQLAASTPALDKTVIGTDDVATLATAMNVLTIGPSQISQVQSRLAQSLAQTLPLGPASGYWSGLTTPFTLVTQLPTKAGPISAAPEFVYRNTLGKYARVLAGSLPEKVTSRHGTSTIAVAVTTATAKLCGLRVGRLIRLPGRLNLRVTGIVAPRDAHAPFWTVDPILAAPTLVQPQNAPSYWQVGVIVPAAALAPLQSMFDPSSTQLTWVYPLALGHLTAVQATSLDRRIANTLATAGQLPFSSFQSLANVTLFSGAATVLGEFVSQGLAVDGVLDLMLVSLAVVGAAIVLLTAWLMAEQRREEFAMLRARGASRRQLSTAALTASAIAALPAAAVGAVIAVTLTQGAGAPAAWWLAGLTVVTALAGPVIITVRQHRRSAAGAPRLTARPDRPAGRMQAIRRLVAEAALTLLCVGALIVLRHQASGRHGDLVASAAPALIAVPVAILMLRLYPAAVRLLLRLATRRGGVVGFLGLARAGRVAATAVLPAFAMVLALSLVSFAGMVRAAVVRGEVTQSWQAVGADAVVSTAPAAMSGAEQRSVAAVPGVLATAPIAVTAASRGRAGSGLIVLITDPAQYSSMLAHTPLGRPPAAFADWHGAAGRGKQLAVIPVLGSAGAAAEFSGSADTVEVAGQRLRVYVVGTAPAMSQLPEIGNSAGAAYLILPSSALGAGAPAPDALLAAGPDLDSRALTHLVASWHGKGGSVTLRSVVLASLERAPVQRDTYTELLFGGIAAAVGCLLVLLLVLLLSARSRRLTLARTATMGLSTAQGRWLTLVEALPQLVAVVIGGLICALGLAPLVGPALDLAVFTGSATPVPVRIDPVWLTAAALGLLVLAMATLSVQTVLADREAPRSLRIGG